MRKSFHRIHLARLLRRLDRMAGGLGLFNQSLEPEALIALAQQQTRLDDFGNWSFREPLEVLVEAYRKEAGLTALGRMAVCWDMVRFLSNLLRLCLEEKKDPAIVDEPVEQPIFILGLPRSGTTFLHNLLAQDPGNLAPLCWQTIYPYPLQTGARDHQDPRPRIVARQFAGFLWLAPELPSLHPLQANATQECIEITGHVIRSLRFDTTHYIPSYAKWLDAAGHHEAYRFHKRFLQHLQHQTGRGQWVLKSPDHIYAMDSILETYPDARFVFVHRDPMEVLPSVARLTEILREPFTNRVDRLQIGRQVADRWVLGARLLIETSNNLRAAPSRIFHVRYRTLVRDPFATVRELYAHFGLAVKADAETRLQSYIAARPRGGYGVNTYRLEDYGLDPEVERHRYRDYIAYFRIGTEAVTDLAPRRRQDHILANRG
jgi:hypothetical protein